MTGEVSAEKRNNNAEKFIPDHIGENYFHIAFTLTQS
jgi:hypothetical protein